MIVQIYSDGSCLGNPGPGGWAALLRCQGKELELCGHQENTTNNRMELMAAIEALAALKRPSQVEFYTDSNYVQKGISEWLPRWIAKGWKTSQRKPVVNQDLWKRLAELNERHQVSWRWVKAHSGHAENERVDDLARQQATIASAGAPPE